jgi:hypothetical protein
MKLPKGTRDTLQLISFQPLAGQLNFFTIREAQAIILHEYEKSPRGTRMRSTMCFLGLVPPGLPEIWKFHDEFGVGTFPGFLPDLYKVVAGC